MEGSTESGLSSRAVFAGCLLGALLSAGNVYTGLKTGFVDGGSISAAVLAFALFKGARGRLGAFSVAENNLSQTIASAAGLMAPTIGVVGAVAALSMTGHDYPAWALAALGIALGTLGVALGGLLRQRLIVEERLPFPTGRATAEVIQAMHTAASNALGRARVLLALLVIAAVVTWFRDVRPVLPQALFLPFGPTALTAASVWLGVSLSPVMIASGTLIGPRASSNMLAGGVVAWGLLAPIAVSRNWVSGADYPALVNFLLWPGVALLLSSSLVALLMEWRNIARGLGDLRFRRTADEPAGAALSARTLSAAIGISVIATVALCTGVFGLHPLITLAALALSALFATVTARATGETDIAPASTGGVIAQLLLGSPSVVTSLVSGNVVAGVSAQTAQMLWAFKAGERLAAPPRPQFIGQLIGVVLGALVVVPVYVIVAQAYGLGNVRMPAPGAVSWKATAEAVQLGSALPTHTLVSSALAFLLGAALTLLGRTRSARWLPSPIPVGIAFIIPASLSGAIFVGGLLALALAAFRPKAAEDYLPSAAAGAIAGESLIGVVIALLLATGVLG